MENIVRKGEIACNKQFLLFSQSFLCDLGSDKNHSDFSDVVLQLLSDDKILDWSESKQIADDILLVKCN